MVSVRIMTAGGNAGDRIRAALVTGGTGGIGRVIAANLAADGFDVAVAYAGSVEEADATVKEIAGHGRRGAAFAADIADEEATSAVFDAIEDRFGHLDVVVHTAGINRPAALADLDLGAVLRDGSTFAALLEARIVKSTNGTDPSPSSRSRAASPITVPTRAPAWVEPVGGHHSPQRAPPEFGWLPHANGRRESSGLTMWAIPRRPPCADGTTGEAAWAFGPRGIGDRLLACWVPVQCRTCPSPATGAMRGPRHRDPPPPAAGPAGTAMRHTPPGR